MTREYPAEIAGPYDGPPQSLTDAEGRDIVVDRAGTEAFETLVAMYVDFDPGDRAQGIPPIGEEEIREWLDAVLAADSFNVVASHGDRAVGHATLVPDTDDHELAIFVLQAYQEAGIGTRLIQGLLGHGRANGVETVWLTVERWNHAAVSLYEKIGFEASRAESFELEMRLRLAPADG